MMVMLGGPWLLLTGILTYAVVARREVFRDPARRLSLWLATGYWVFFTGSIIARLI